MLKPLGMVLLAMAAAGVVGLAWLASAFDADLREVSRHPAPDGSMELTVYSGSGFISSDPTWELRPYTRNGLLSRESDLGCIDSNTEYLNNIEWVGPRTVRVNLQGPLSNGADLVPGCSRSASSPHWLRRASPLHGPVDDS